MVRINVSQSVRDEPLINCTPCELLSPLPLVRVPPCFKLLRNRISQVCRHHAAVLAPPGAGSASSFRCGYHGWTYGLDGRLLRATRLAGIQGFRAAEHGLRPLQADEWGGFVWLRPAPATPGDGEAPSQTQKQPEGRTKRRADQQQQVSGSGSGVAAWLGAQSSAAALAAGIADPLAHVASREYELQCNWKVFVDNYLVGPGAGWGPAGRARAGSVQRGHRAAAAGRWRRRGARCGAAPQHPAACCALRRRCPPPAGAGRRVRTAIEAVPLACLALCASPQHTTPSAPPLAPFTRTLPHLVSAGRRIPRRGGAPGAGCRTGPGLVPQQYP